MSIRRKLQKIKGILKYGVTWRHMDSKFYYLTNVDVASAKLNAFIHYSFHGWKEGRDPAPWFSTKDYLESNPDVAASGMNPFYHYLRDGWREGRSLRPSDMRASTAYFNKYANFSPSRSVDHVQAFRDYFVSLHAADGENEFAQLIDTLVAECGEFPILPTGDLPLELHMAAIHKYFDREFYLEKNPDVARSGSDPLVHYCTSGWWELRRPNPNFDVWWYWSNYLNVEADSIDPLLHFATIGEDRGYKTENISPICLRSDAISYTSGQKIRRACLFAAYDAHGIVDDYVLDYLRELSKFADIFYLADCDMQPGEMDKLKGLVKEAWCIRHGEYDFGSYARLARELVGWDVLGQYDELILANDSCYLLRPLDDVFAKMDGLTTDWWGMQATKGLSVTRDEDQKRFKKPISLEAIKENYLDSFENDYFYNFHLGSYFVVYRKAVLNDETFRSMLNSVVKQKNKALIIKKYENGFTRHLIHRGYQFHTFIDELYPFHPIYTESIFTLIEKGFPLFKRFLLAENHYFVSGLGDWKEKVQSLIPSADLTAIEKNLYRVSNHEKIYNNFRVYRDANYNPVYPQLYSNPEIASLDEKTAKYDHWWAFPVCAYDHTFSGNERAVFEEIRYNPSIKKIILTRSKHVDIPGENIEIVPLKSREGQDFLLKSKVVFIKHSVAENVTYPLNADHHHFINLWHGIPLKRIGYASLDHISKLAGIAEEQRRSRAVISSSKVDTLAMTAGFYPLSYHDVWMTGLPRNDFIVREFDLLPDDLKAEELKLRKIIGDRKFILFCPTFRNGVNGSGYQFSDDELSALRVWLAKNNAVLGVREHMADKHKTYKKQLSGEHVIDVSSLFYPNIETLFRVSDAMVTDYSSCFVDYIMTGKHQISFAYDLDSYQNLERGMFYDLDFCFPGDICRKFSDVIASLERAVGNEFKNIDPAFEWKRALFFEYNDDGSSARLVNRVHSLIGDC